MTVMTVWARAFAIVVKKWTIDIFKLFCRRQHFRALELNSHFFPFTVIGAKHLFRLRQLL